MKSNKRPGIKRKIVFQPAIFRGGYVDVSENSGTPKWMVYNGKPY